MCTYITSCNNDIPNSNLEVKVSFMCDGIIHLYYVAASWHRILMWFSIVFICKYVVVIKRGRVTKLHYIFIVLTSGNHDSDRNIARWTGERQLRTFVFNAKFCAFAPRTNVRIRIDLTPNHRSRKLYIRTRLHIWTLKSRLNSG